MSQVWSIGSPSISTEGGRTRVAWDIGGHALWYVLPEGRAPASCADAVLAATLLPAMRAGVGLRLDPALAVSPRMLAGTARLQEIFSVWYPELRPVAVGASASVPAVGEPAVVASCFSGGVDSCYSLLKNRDRITHLLLVRGVDLKLGNVAGWEDANEGLGAIAAAFGKPLLRVESSIRDFSRESAGLGWPRALAGGLSSVGHLLGVRTLVIPSSNPYTALHPYGSHPLTDPMWSSEVVKVEHDGSEARRAEKLRRIVEEPVLLENIRVCWQDRGYNCGHCDKCVHLQVALRLLGRTTPRIAPLRSLRDIASYAQVNTPGEYLEWEDNLRLAREVGDRTIERALARLLARFRVKESLGELDRLWFGGGVRRLASRLRGGGRGR
jgi:hypothetical protein